MTRRESAAAEAHTAVREREEPRSAGTRAALAEAQRPSSRCRNPRGPPAGTPGGVCRAQCRCRGRGGCVLWDHSATWGVDVAVTVTRGGGSGTWGAEARVPRSPPECSGKSPQPRIMEPEMPTALQVGSPGVGWGGVSPSGGLGDDGRAGPRFPLGWARGKGALGCRALRPSMVWGTAQGRGSARLGGDTRQGREEGTQSRAPARDQRQHSVQTGRRGDEGGFISAAPVTSACAAPARPLCSAPLRTGKAAGPRTAYRKGTPLTGRARGSPQVRGQGEGPQRCPQR